ncbi:MAG: hypothetical protein IKU72_05295 [Oscillospiraceae bacterium]|nr:hypothetical protein [Oscillospiraceae bacterium]
MKKRDRNEQFDQIPQADELAKVRKQRQRKRFWQRVAALVLACAAVWGVLFLRKDIARLELGMRLSDLMASYSSGNGYPVDLPSGRVLNTAAVGKDFALLTDTNLNLYNSQGKLTGIYEHGYTTPICLANGDRVLTYDRGGKRLRVDSRSQQLFSKELDYSIVTANIASSGHIAVVSDAKYYENCITVYDSEYDEIYIRETARLITGVALETKGGGMATADLNAVGGRLDSTVTFFSFTSEEPVASVVLSDQVVLSMEFVGREEPVLQVITDQQALVINQQGRIIASFGFDGLFVNRFANNKAGGIFLLLDELGDGNRLQLMSLDSSLNLLGSVHIEERVQDMRIGDGFLCLYSGGKISCWSRDLSQSQNMDIQGWYNIQPAGQNLYGITANTIELTHPEEELVL